MRNRIAHRIVARSLAEVESERGTLEPSDYLRKDPGASDPRKLITQKEHVQELHRSGKDSVHEAQDLFKEHEGYGEIRGLVRYLIDNGKQIQDHPKAMRDLF